MQFIKQIDMEEKRPVEEVLTKINPHSWFYGIREDKRKDFLKRVDEVSKKFLRDDMGGNKGIHKKNIYETD